MYGMYAMYDMYAMYAMYAMYVMYVVYVMYVYEMYVLYVKWKMQCTSGIHEDPLRWACHAGTLPKTFPPARVRSPPLDSCVFVVVIWV